MRIHVVQEIAASVDAVESAVIDPAFIARLAELPKLGAPQLLDQQVDGAVVTQQVRYQFVGELNAAVRRAVDPARMTWVEITVLDRRTHETAWRIEPDHYPNLLRANGTIVLEAVTADLTRRVGDFDLRVTFPLVAGPVERAIASGLEEHAALEAGAMSEWLSRPA